MQPVRSLQPSLAPGSHLGRSARPLCPHHLPLHHQEETVASPWSKERLVTRGLYTAVTPFVNHVYIHGWAHPSPHPVVALWQVPNIPGSPPRAPVPRDAAYFPPCLVRDNC